MHRLSDQQKARLTTWIVDQHRARERMPKVTSDVIDETNQRRPLRMSERKTRFLLLASLSNFQASSTFKISGNTDDKYWRDSGAVCAWTESSSVKEAQYFVGLLYQDGIVRLVDNSGAYQLTSKGFAQLEAVETGGASLRQCFIAMWFDPSMEGARKAIEEAVQDCDYRPMRIDAKEHGNKIDDEIIAEIRRSRFVVADFTCPTTDLEDKIKGRDCTRRRLLRSGICPRSSYTCDLDLSQRLPCLRAFRYAPVQSHRLAKPRGATPEASESHPGDGNLGDLFGPSEVGSWRMAEGSHIFRQRANDIEVGSRQNGNRCRPAA
jgi:hypothetical protein